MSPRLRRADCSGPGIRRRRRGRGFSYVDDEGRKVDEPEVLARIAELAIPPAWKDVWICPYPNGHLQATGTDAAGRKQYRYHDAWRARRDNEKFEDMVRFAHALPRLRRRVERDLGDCTALDRALRARRRDAAARARVLPHRLGGVRGGERLLRPRDAAQGARRRRGRRPDGVRLPGQERAAPPPGRRGRARQRRSSRRSSGGAAAATSCSPTSSGRRWHDLRSDDINDYVKDGHGRRLLRQGLPHLERDRARRRRARGLLRGGGDEDGAQARGPARDRGGRRATSATRPRSAAPPTSTRACSTPTRAD